MQDSFVLLDNFDYKGTKLHRYISTKTGLRVYFAGVESPIVNAFMSVATEAYSHNGTPHTLEHLIFLGSEDYPYKGILDQLANRCLASGTNVLYCFIFIILANNNSHRLGLL